MQMKTSDAKTVLYKTYHYNFVFSTGSGIHAGHFTVGLNRALHTSQIGMGTDVNPVSIMPHTHNNTIFSGKIQNEIFYFGL